MSSRWMSSFAAAAFGFMGTGIAAACCLCSVACSSSSSSNATSTDQACTDSAHAVCTEMQSCAPANVQGTYGDEATCEARVKATCLDSLAAPSTGGSPTKTEACAQAYKSYACTDYLDKTNIPAACAQATGSLANGAACLYAAQCQSGFCAIVPGNACGTCAATPKAGDSCAQLTSCGQALTCATDTLVCTTLAVQGQPCGPGQPCGAGLSCVARGGNGTSGTCQTAGSQVGAACDGALKTGPGCDDALGLYCDGAKKKCAQATYAAGGQPCGYDSAQGSYVGCTGGTCEGADAAKGQLGTCTARASDNSACAVPDGGASTPSAGCLPSARCIAPSGTCQVITASSCH